MSQKSFEGNLLYAITLRSFVVPTLSMVGDPLPGNGCGSPNHVWF